MKDKIKIYIMFIICSTLLAGCSNDDDNEPGTDENGTGETIRLVSSSEVDESSVITTRSAISDLIGAGDIGVIGALHTTGGTPVDWTSYPDLDNAKAYAVSVNGGIYSFDWETRKYWPFDGTQLVFKAYYPYTDNGAGAFVNLDDLRKNLALTLPLSDPDDMPDVMVASGNLNASSRPYNKESEYGRVALGQFRHVLSQLTVEVVRKDNNVDPDLMVDNLTISTNNSIGNVSLDSLVLSVMDGPGVSYRYVNAPTPIPNLVSDYTALLFPGTEDNVWITVDVGKGTTWVTRSFPVSSFTNVNDQNEEVKLERARRTTLRIEIAGLPVQDGLELNLKATLSEWNHKGNFVVNVK